ncbi:hypothetical protein RBSWK_02201 [Rhodopirellula baltica SWK14]|uniref:Uncharacterized protein n=1 Tax=Rhodopirellula baltica SWK14 TaxID=993516 RepID=L7CJQ7_RHOBT|nr:hypothetical protein RBSWK_02201 [Rhodopirellula baltica SWK14]
MEEAPSSLTPNLTNLLGSWLARFSSTDTQRCRSNSQELAFSTRERVE